ncbi:MAG: hypothetical protein Ct9H300mP7_4480 [Verrucomicrobiota bacterium]|nr:MAG: hypothetical protein Ct9H300mP7_4480 [Verrucomicrobiota bacterium]
MVAAFALAPKKNEFRFALGNRINPTKSIWDRRREPLEKLVFPSWAGRRHKGCGRLLAPLDRDDKRVVGHRGLLFAGLTFRPFRLTNLDSVKETPSASASPQIQSSSLCQPQVAGVEQLGVEQRAVGVKQANLDLVVRKPGGREIAMDRYRRILECR